MRLPYTLARFASALRFPSAAQHRSGPGALHIYPAHVHAPFRGGMDLLHPALVNLDGHLSIFLAPDFTQGPGDLLVLGGHDEQLHEANHHLQTLIIQASEEGLALFPESGAVEWLSRNGGALSPDRQSPVPMAFIADYTGFL